MEKPIWSTSISSLTKAWKDEEEFHREVNETFACLTNEVPELKELRDWVEANVWGFGERSFYWMWKLLVDEMPEYFNFMEIGVFRGQILTLIGLLAKNKKHNRVAISPFDSTDGYWESDYYADVMTLEQKFNPGGRPLIIFKGLSSDPNILKDLKDNKVNLLYIDGGHSEEVVKLDLENYTPLLIKGGYLVIDDSAVNLNLPNGYFRGHESVTKAVEEFMKDNKDFTHLFNVVHNRVWKKL